MRIEAKAMPMGKPGLFACFSPGCSGGMLIKAKKLLNLNSLFCGSNRKCDAADRALQEPRESRVRDSKNLRAFDLSLLEFPERLVGILAGTLLAQEF